jgi:hypothetical protein
VIVAVIAMWMVQTSIYQVIGVLSMRYCGVAATRSMLMGRLVSAMILGRAVIGVLCSYFDNVFVHLTLMRVVEMATMKIIHVALVSNRDMTTTWTVNVRMIGGSHGLLLEFCGNQ